MNKRKICVVTGSRAEYGLLKSVMEEVNKSATLELQLIVAGMHLSKTFGYTIREIKKDNFKITSQVEVLPRDDTPAEIAKSIGRGIVGFSSAFIKIKPDIVMVLGDRSEILAASIAAVYSGLPLAHIHGGDSTKAGYDENARHAITKLAHIHFPATKKSAERIIKMGEDRWRVFTVGAPGLDEVMNQELLSEENLSKKYKLDFSKKILLVVQHPVTTQVNESGFQMEQTLEAVAHLGLQAIIIYPNSDAGGKKMIDKIKEYRKFEHFKIFPSISRIDYLSFLKHGSVLIGNSSSGIIETPLFCLPVVNIGIRQEGRERSTNIIDVEHSKKDIINAIKQALFDEDFRKKLNNCKNPYGDGKASVRISKFLSKIEINDKLMQKKITY